MNAKPVVLMMFICYGLSWLPPSPRDPYLAAVFVLGGLALAIELKKKP